MDASADSESVEKDAVVSGKSRAHVDDELTAIASEGQQQCENAPSEVAQAESLSDWLVVLCVFLCNLLNGLNFASCGVLYLPIAEMFQSTRAAVGWILSFNIALASFLGQLNAFVAVVMFAAIYSTSLLFRRSAIPKIHCTDTY